MVDELVPDDDVDGGLLPEVAGLLLGECGQVGGTLLFMGVLLVFFVFLSGDSSSSRLFFSLLWLCGGYGVGLGMVWCVSGRGFGWWESGSVYRSVQVDLGVVMVLQGTSMGRWSSSGVWGWCCRRWGGGNSVHVDLGMAMVVLGTTMGDWSSSGIC